MTHQSQDRASATRIPSPNVESPYEVNPDAAVADLLSHHIPALYGGNDFAMKNLKAIHDPRRLRAIVDQANNAKMSLNHLIKGVGIALAIAADSKELPPSSASDIGWGLNSLAATLIALEELGSNATCMLDCAEAQTHE